jgi:hypothetical protein
MNLKAWAGYAFFGAADTGERVSLYSSWGLLSDAPNSVVPSFVKRITDWFWEFF